MSQVKYSQRTSCLSVIIIPVMIPSLLLPIILLLSWPLSAIEYASLNCNRLESEPKICKLTQFTCAWPLPKVNYFPTTQLEEAVMESRRGGVHRPTIKVSGQVIPLVGTYTNIGITRTEKVVARIQSFIENSETNSLSVQILPHVITLLSALFLFAILLLATLPFSLLIIAFAYGFRVHIRNLFG